MSTNYWCELNDNQAETVAGGRGGTPSGFFMGYIVTSTYYDADGNVISTGSWSNLSDDYPDGVLDYKDVLVRAASDGYTLKQSVLNAPTKHFQTLNPTRTEKYVSSDGSYSVTKYTDYNFGFEYVVQGSSKVIL